MLDRNYYSDVYKKGFMITARCFREIMINKMRQIKVSIKQCTER